jgi:hypothetical protein
MGAVYPHGRIDVDALTAADVAGFGDDGADVVARAAVIKADALAHAALVPPLQLTIEMDAGVAVARVTDAVGTPVAGVEVAVVPTGPTITGAPRATTGGDGSASFPYTEVVGRTASTRRPPSRISSCTRWPRRRTPPNASRCRRRSRSRR